MVADVTLFEKSDRLGGHADTGHITIDGKDHALESGFEFFSHVDFPLFSRYLTLLKVPINEFDLTYSFERTFNDGPIVKRPNEVIVFTPITAKGMNWKALASSLWNLGLLLQFFLLMLCAKFMIARGNRTMSVRQLADSIFLLSDRFKQHMAYPLFAAAWSVTPSQLESFGAYSALKGIASNMSFSLRAPTWHEVRGGNDVYICAVANQIKASTKLELAANIISLVLVDGEYVLSLEDGRQMRYDHVVIATESMQAVQLIRDLPVSEALRSCLVKIEHCEVITALHGDTRFVPEMDWQRSVVNVTYDHSSLGAPAMTVCKPWRYPAEKPLFRSWIPKASKDSMPSPLYHLRKYFHPMINDHYQRAQEAIVENQGKQGLWFVGAYTCEVVNHESAVLSAMRVAEKLHPSSVRLHDLRGADHQGKSGRHERLEFRGHLRWPLTTFCITMAVLLVLELALLRFS